MVGVTTTNPTVDVPRRVLCIHGFAANQQSWLGLQPEFESCRELHTIDLPGHGVNWQEDPPKDLRALAASLWDAQENHDLDLVGHSLGGSIALHMASIEPKRVTSITLLAPAGLGLGVRQKTIQTLLQLDNEHAALRWLQALVHDPKFIPPVLASMLLEHLQRPGVNQRLTTMADMMYSDREALQLAIDSVIDHQLPRQVIWGREDKLNALNKHDIKRFGGQWELLNNCAHLTHIEKRVKVGQLIKNMMSHQSPHS